MIPTIEQIINDLLAGDIAKEQAINWLYQHTEPVSSDLRDMYAGMAMQGLCADRHHSDTQGSPRNIALIAYEVADSMLKERES